MSDVAWSAGWWVALAAAVLVHAFAARARMFFRALGPVSLEALVDRLGEETMGFLRKSLRGPTGLWFTLQMLDAGAFAAFVVVLFAGTPSFRVGDVRVALYPTGGLIHDGLLLVSLLAWLVLMEFVVPVVTARIDRTSFIERSLPIIRVVHRVLAPVSEPLARLIADEPEDGQAPAVDEEVEAFIDVGTREGILEAGEGEMIKNLVTFGDTRVREVMTPRIDIVGIGAGATIREVVALMARSRFSRIPVFAGQIDDIVGVATLKDAVAALQEGLGEQGISRLLRRPLIVPESKRTAELLRELQASRQQLALVVDEFGGLAGLVTVEDLLEELVGEIREEHEVGEDIFRLPDGTWQVRGRALVHDVGEALGVALESSHSDTVGGLLVAHLQRVPRQGETVDHAGCRFEVEQADRKRVLQVRISVPGAPREVPGEEGGQAIARAGGDRAPA